MQIIKTFKTKNQTLKNQRPNETQNQMIIRNRRINQRIHQKMKRKRKGHKTKVKVLLQQKKEENK